MKLAKLKAQITEMQRLGVSVTRHLELIAYIARVDSLNAEQSQAELEKLYPAFKEDLQSLKDLAISIDI
jgi:hypothetical protein